MKMVSTILRAFFFLGCAGAIFYALAIYFNVLADDELSEVADLFGPYAKKSELMEFLLEKEFDIHQRISGKWSASLISRVEVKGKPQPLTNGYRFSDLNLPPPGYRRKLGVLDGFCPASDCDLIYARRVVVTGLGIVAHDYGGLWVLDPEFNNRVSHSINDSALYRSNF